MRTKNKYHREGIRTEKELFICEQLAQLKTPNEIIGLWQKKNPTDGKLSAQLIYYYKKTYTAQIEDMRDKIMEKSLEVPIANEKIRLQRTENLYQVSASILHKKDRVDTSLKCLKEAREECKGEAGASQSYLQFNQYNELSDTELLEKKKEIERKFLELTRKGDSYAKEQGA